MIEDLESTTGVIAALWLVDFSSSGRTELDLSLLPIMPSRQSHRLVRTEQLSAARNAE